MIESYIKQYPTLNHLFGSSGASFHDGERSSHPLVKLILTGNNITSMVASRTDKCAKNVNRASPGWLSKRAATIISDKDMENVSSAFGEIRAYGELLWVWDDKVHAKKSGSDFQLDYYGKTILIEVFTQQHRTVRYMQEIESKTFTFDDKKVSSKMLEVFPFGWPDRSVDTVQGEAVSKIAQIKQKEHQLDQCDISIVWVDLQDPGLWSTGFGRHQFFPITCWQENMTSGCVWSALYAKEGDYVYDNLSTLGMYSEPYKMEFPGRFQKDSKVDFFVFDTAEDQIVFQNHNGKKEIPDRLFMDFFRLYKFNYEASWLDWPMRGHLPDRIENTLEQLRLFKDAFRRD